MKKIIAIILSILLVISTFTFVVNAQSNISFSVTLNDDGDGNVVYEVEIRGVCSAYERVFIEVVNEYDLGTTSDDVTVVMEQVVCGSDGNFSCTKEFDDGGNFKVYINGYNSGSASKTLSLKEQSYYETAVSTFTGSNTDAIKTLLDSEGSELGFDMKFYNDSSKNAIASKISGIDGITKFNLSESFDKAVVVAYLSTPALHNKANDIIAYYDSLLGIKSSIYGMYTSYLEFDSEEKNAILADAFSNLDDVSDAKSLFEFSVAKNVIELMSATQVDNFITDHNDYYGFLGYEDLTTVQKAKLIAKLKEEDLGSSQSDLADVYNELSGFVDDDDDDDDNRRPSGGSSGSSIISGKGGNGGVSVSTSAGAWYGTESISRPTNVGVGQISFNDLDSVEWARDDIMSLAKLGVVNGKTETTFAPADNITRKEYSKILSLAFDIYSEYATCDFTDIPSDDWAYKYIASIKNGGYITGYEDGSFGGNDNITRQDIAVILYRYMVKNKLITDVTEISSDFKDAGNISDYAENAVLMLAQTGIITGSDGFFNPKSPATRAEVCVIINRALNYAEKGAAK